MSKVQSKRGAAIFVGVWALACLDLGCSTTRTRTDERPSIAPQDSPIAPPAATQSVDELKATIGALTSRIEGLEGRIETINERFEQKNHSKTPVKLHPAEGVGAEVESKQAPHDPELGFSTDRAVVGYREAMLLFEAKKYSEAVLGFSSFLERFPDHPLAGSAQFYIGESYFEQKDYSAAIQEFQRVVTSYDRSPQISQSMRKLAESYDFINKPNEAAKYRQILTSLFPASPAARVDEVSTSSAASQAVPPTASVNEESEQK